MSPCKKCDAKCCRYIALQLDTPRSKIDFENLRWYLTHQRTAIFVDDKKWFLEVFTDCRYLDEDDRCLIYDKRPLICREHSTDNCEFWGEDYEHDFYFKKLEDLDAYIANRFKSKRKSIKR